MSLLQEIQNSAVDSKTDLPSLLRKCQILAARLKYGEFKNWVSYELNGYPDISIIPHYRKMQTQSFGHFSGPWGSGLRNAPIPPMCIPNEYHDIIKMVYLREGVCALQNLIAHDKSGSLHEQWPADLIAFVGNRIYQNQNLNQAWKTVPVSFVVGILDTVRNRILQFALEIELTAPNIGEAPLPPSLTSDKISNVFNTYILGNVANMATGNTNVSQIATINIDAADWNGLVTYLKSLDVEKADISELESAIKEEPSVSENKFGKRVSSWIGKMVSKSAQGLWSIGTSVASDLLSKALVKYYGLPSG